MKKIKNNIYNYLLFLILFIFCNSCDSKSNKIKIYDSDNEQIKMIKRADSFYNIFNYKFEIDLETVDSCLIGMLSQVIVFEKSKLILTVDKNNNSLFLFDSKGRFLNKIGRRGKGPGEYSSIQGVVIKNDSIYVVDNEFKIYLYNCDGKFLNQYNLRNNNYNFSPDKMLIINEIIYVYSRNPYFNYAKNKKQYKILKFNKEFNYLSGLLNPISEVEGNFISGGGLVALNNKIIVSDVTSGKLYSISKKDSIGIFCDFGNLYDLSKYSKVMNNDILLKKYISENMMKFDGIRDLVNVNDYLIVNRMKRSKKGISLITILDKNGYIIQNNLPLFNLQDAIMEYMNNDNKYITELISESIYYPYSKGIIIPVLKKNIEKIPNPTLRFYEMKEK